MHLSNIWELFVCHLYLLYEYCTKVQHVLQLTVVINIDLKKKLLYWLEGGKHKRKTKQYLSIGLIPCAAFVFHREGHYDNKSNKIFQLLVLMTILQSNNKSFHVTRLYTYLSFDV